ncbi:MAG: UDP-N-acetylmuramate dehydrogenase [Candidatus Obscuribacter sp.]|jgi:UDP-N-acetylmuramate dehydrogenase|nr:UDP-N-acetylmuramate dehydrogenase [Candidatus Obscuribacter sp.]MBL0187330.1 UDP-N-acetylmuramate dehydrogenase [Candidatus Obscuribacter sp.]MBP6351781.1 UDP-N-acetylmuramate dehydrogenase [Candidatus Obscuribacter sp.]MBP6594170.1 UDP-N-acetylmuramate dehydrogenase [Candidatus Obscuribacter sp.]MBP7575754.1 UDP-N-acetylmuramate dehydrogenase [Candidatus Obscuribacter sp.]
MKSSLSRQPLEEILNAPLARYTTLRVGGNADKLYQPASVEELANIVQELKHKGEPWYVIGGGSNLLISSEGVRGSVIRTTGLTGIKILEPGLLEAEAGARLPHLARHAAQQGLSGLEFAVGIPGTVGGGVIMNAGAHGSSMSAILESALVLDTTTGEITEMLPDQIKFEYRRCALDPKQHVVLSAKFRMPQDEPEAIEARTRHNEEYRWKTQPLGFPNAGSTFKNPFPDKTAGFLLDKSGVKDMKEGNAAVSSIHANFVINLGNATSHEIVALLKRMQASVAQNFDIDLTPEWKTMGEFTEEELSIWRNKK